MSVMDKFLDVMRLNPDEDYEYDNEDYELEEEEVPPRKPSYKEKKEEHAEENENAERSHQSKEKGTRSSSKITPISKGTRKQALEMEVCVIKPNAIDEELEIVDTLLNGRTVIINMEGLNVELAQRIIDFISGSTYAIHGNMQKISNYIFLATPNGVDISGDIQDIMESFDLPGFTV
ncbi:MAG: cell division protein SepF [Agathobacter sp.]|nr:cell division protein SepF [Agathobacter sp.]